MIDQAIDMTTFLLFIIPGFITVWSYRYATYSEKTGEFELIGLSFFWGVTILLLVAALAPSGALNAALDDRWRLSGVAFAFSLVGGSIAFFAALFKKKNRLQSAWKYVKKWFKE